jgi:hypothetical protein
LDKMLHVYLQQPGQAIGTRRPKEAIYAAGAQVFASMMIGFGYLGLKLRASETFSASRTSLCHSDKHST